MREGYILECYCHALCEIPKAPKTLHRSNKDDNLRKPLTIALRGIVCILVFSLARYFFVFIGECAYLTCCALESALKREKKKKPTVSLLACIRNTQVIIIVCDVYRTLIRSNSSNDNNDLLVM